ncbi:MAG: YidC/Oxa1 family insertase periplasmic-domain containing protein, partial [Planctomycetaceae bacterium]
GTLEILKRYSLQKYPGPKTQLAAARDTFAEGYQLGMELTLRNLSGETQDVQYHMIGPAGLPLENAEHTSKYRDIKIGVWDEGDVTISDLSADDLVEAIEDNEVEAWREPVRFAGVDVQYFAGFLIPQEPQTKQSYFEKIEPYLIAKRAEDKHSDITIELVSKPLTLSAAGEAGDEATHSYRLYAGPKREALLSEFGAEDAIEFGYMGLISKGMLGVLKFLHETLSAPYWLAIVLLTLMVRSLLFPLSRKQAQSMQKMKDLQPKLMELRKKYANDKEKQAMAQMELYRKYNVNPLAGCLPLLLQMPIFIGLYAALGNAVELRRESFLWIDNLAAPDALIRLPFSLPFLGADFNLLPIVTIALFMVQQKFYMPPPANEEQELQQKMMKFMMIFMGFMFYHVPAGLCLYFITSSSWGMIERKLLKLTTAQSESGPTDGGDEGDGEGNGVPAPREPDQPQGEQKETFWSRLLAKADAAAAQSTGQTLSTSKSKSAKRTSTQRGQGDGTGKGGTGKRKKGRKSRSR